MDRNLSEFEWKTLDALSDDVESIWSMTLGDGLSGSQDLAGCLISLLEAGLISRADSGTVSLTEEELESDFDRRENARYWFVLTPDGCSEWERHSRKFRGEPVDWSTAWRAYIDATEVGFVEGVSREICLEVLHSQLGDRGDWNLVREQELEQFSPKYYKTLERGYRIDFRVAKVGPPRSSNFTSDPLGEVR